MSYEQKDNSGSIFKNDRKERDNHPDRTGSALIDGVEYWISGWIKSGQKGQFLSLAFKRKEVKDAPQSITQRAQAAMQRQRGDSDADMSDDIPF